MNLERNLSSRGASLLIREGDPSQVIREVLTEFNIEKVFLNREDTPYGLARDKEIERTCCDFGVLLELCPDDHLTVPGLVTKNDGSPYTVKFGGECCNRARAIVKTGTSSERIP